MGSHGTFWGKLAMGEKRTQAARRHLNRLPQDASATGSVDLACLRRPDESQRWRMDPETLPLDRRLRQEILLARERVYRFGSATPLERLVLPGPGPEIWVKREDLSRVKAYKWRGACNRMAGLTTAEAACGVVTASAGNHAQGVAIFQASITLPDWLPKQEQAEMRHQHGLGKQTVNPPGQSHVEGNQHESKPYIRTRNDQRTMQTCGRLF